MHLKFERLFFNKLAPEHQSEASSQKTINISGISKHERECPSRTIIWKKPAVIQTMVGMSKLPLQKKLLTRGSLEIKRYNSVENGYNDPQLHVDTDAWYPLLKRLCNEDMRNLGAVRRKGHGD